MNPLKSQLRNLAPLLVVLYSFPLLALAASAAMTVLRKIPPLTYMRDLAQVAGVHPLTGFISNLGALFWCAAGAITLFTWAVLRARSEYLEFSRFFLFSGLFTTFLMVDDFFILHDRILPHYFGIDEVVTFGVYIVLILLGLWVFRRTILKTEYLLLVIALTFFGLSMIADVLQPLMQSIIGNWRNLIEDGFKFLGIVGWFGYFCQTCSVRVRSALSSAPT